MLDPLNTKTAFKKLYIFYFILSVQLSTIFIILKKSFGLTLNAMIWIERGIMKIKLNILGGQRLLAGTVYVKCQF